MEGCLRHGTTQGTPSFCSSRFTWLTLVATVVVRFHGTQVQDRVRTFRCSSCQARRCVQLCSMSSRHECSRLNGAMSRPTRFVGVVCITRAWYRSSGGVLWVFSLRSVVPHHVWCRFRFARNITCLVCGRSSAIALSRTRLVLSPCLRPCGVIH